MSPNKHDSRGERGGDEALLALQQTQSGQLLHTIEADASDAASALAIAGFAGTKTQPKLPGTLYFTSQRVKTQVLWRSAEYGSQPKLICTLPGAYERLFHDPNANRWVAAILSSGYLTFHELHGPLPPP